MEEESDFTVKGLNNRQLLSLTILLELNKYENVLGSNQNFDIYEHYVNNSHIFK